MKWILLSILIVSCSKKGDGSHPSSVNAVEAEMSGVYQALLAPVNKSVSGHLNGSLTLLREENLFVADVRFSAGPASILHAQNIHVGVRCPDEGDDTNGDGFIDAVEAAQVYREALIPLDGDLNSQRMGSGTFPVANEFGYYFYSQAASFEKLVQDLRDVDLNPHDQLTKLKDSEFKLHNKVIVISGIPESVLLPESVLAGERSTPHASLPIACGIIRPLEKVPGRIDDDRTGIPVPEGEIVGGSSGADDGANFPPTTTSGGETSGDYGDDGES